MSDDDFIRTYLANKPAVEPIPHWEMNYPVVGANKKADIGLELEVEARNNLPGTGHVSRVVSESKSYWEAKGDGSLRGNAVEYVLHTPCVITEVPFMVNGLYEMMKGFGTVLSLSNRCSTHVHVNIGGKMVNELTAVIALWTTLEEALINWCGEQRTTNHFCLGSKDSLALVNAWYDFLRTGDMFFDEGMKYGALNPRTIHEFGSLEFRCMRADENPQTIIDWTTLVYNICEYAYEKYQQPQLLANDLSEKGAEDIFRDIVRRANLSLDFERSVIDHPLTGSFHQTCMRGFRRVQPILMEYPWDAWLEMIRTPKEKETKKKANVGTRRRRDIAPALRHDNPFLLRGDDPVLGEEAPHAGRRQVVLRAGDAIRLGDNPDPFIVQPDLPPVPVVNQVVEVVRERRALGPVERRAVWDELNQRAVGIPVADRRDDQRGVDLLRGRGALAPRIEPVPVPELEDNPGQWWMDEDREVDM